MYLKVITTLAVIGCVAMLVAMRRFERVREDGRSRARPALAEARLDATVARLRLDGAPLERALDALRQGGLNIVVDPDVLDDAPILRPVSLELRDVLLSTALRLILDQAGGEDVGLEYGVRDGVIVIAKDLDVWDRTTLRFYDVKAFAPPPAPPPAEGEEDERASAAGYDRIEQLRALVLENVDLESWRDNGGSVGSIDYFNGMFVVRQTPENQLKVEALLDRLTRRREGEEPDRQPAASR